MSLIVVSGAIANKPHQGGSAWVRLSYLRGLLRLGHEVHFVEQIAPAACVDERGRPAPFESSINRAYFDRVMAEFDLADRAALLVTDDRGNCDVPSSLLRLAKSADALLNISGHLSVAPLFECFRKRAYIDIDPGFTQAWHEAGNGAARLAGHDWHFTIGLNVGASDCPIPTGGIRWHPTLPPVVLSDWPLTKTDGALRFTTVANWRGPYAPLEVAGQTLGIKVHEFRKLIELPRHVDAAFELALNIHPADARDRQALKSAGWQIADPTSVAPSPTTFRGYVQQSSAEISAAQSVYVETRSGWFSDRSTRYLASGKPVLVQDTGFSRHLSTGEGLVAFATLDEAVNGARSIAANYADHCRAARRLAEQHFDSDKVLGRMMEEIGVSP